MARKAQEIETVVRLYTGRSTFARTTGVVGSSEKKFGQEIKRHVTGHIRILRWFDAQLQRYMAI